MSFPGFGGSGALGISEPQLAETSSFVNSITLYFQAEKGYIESLTQSIAGGEWRPRFGLRDMAL